MARSAVVLVVLALLVAVGCLPSASRESVASTREAIALGGWTPVPNAGLLGRSMIAMAHDSARGVTVMFGGTQLVTTNEDTSPSEPLAETREWNGKTWSAPMVQANGPKPRVNAAMTYDAVAKRILLYGGRGPFHFADAAIANDTDHPVVYGDMWSYDGTSWTLLCNPCAPGPRESSAMSFDGARGRTVLVGGTDRYWTVPGFPAYPKGATSPQTFETPGMTSTWEWNGTTWLERCPGRSCPNEPYRVDGSMVYDAKHARTLYVGGRPFAYSCVGAQPFGAECDGNAVNARGVPENVYAWDGNAWTVLCEVAVDDLSGNATLVPIASKTCGVLWDQREGLGLVYDTIRDRVILVGGATRHRGPTQIFAHADVLELADPEVGDGPPEWRSLCPPSNPECGPTRRTNAGIAFEPSRGQIVVAGGADSALSALSFDDTWTMQVGGDPCTRDTACDTGHCVDGVCCNVAACGTCETCSSGACSPVRGRDDLDTCGGDRTCALVPRMGPDGKPLVCVRRDGVACTQPSDCASGFCADGVCCNARCDQPCDACTASRGAPKDGTCGPARAGDVGQPQCIARRCTGASPVCEPDAPCVDPEDCEDNYQCSAGKRCTPLVACDQCVPYACNLDGSCKARCESVNDCRAPNVCDSEHRCVALAEGTGSSCAASPRRSDRPWWPALVLALVLRRRRR